MESKNIEFRVGVFVIFALAVFIFAIVWIQGYSLRQDNYKLRVIFDEVGSLANGDPVMVSGIRKGKVTDLNLVNEGVEVVLILSNDVVLKKDAVVTVKNIGLMGERFVAVKQGKSRELLDTSIPLAGSYDTGIPEAMGMMGEMITELRNLVLALKNSVASEENLDKISATIQNFEELSGSILEYLNRNRDNLDKTAQNFLAASKSLDKIISGNVKRVDTTLMRVDNVAARMETIVSDLEHVAKAAHEFADNLNQGDGTLQMMVDDRRLYDDLRKTADNLDDLINDIRENPKKYIQLKVELF
jgi:phospholipid/cholesterol/gamma-HCH transport system substrate-binding protein